MRSALSLLAALIFYGTFVLVFAAGGWALFRSSRDD